MRQIPVLLFLFSLRFAFLFSHQSLNFIEVIEFESPGRTWGELKEFFDRLFDRLRNFRLNGFL